MKTTLIAATLAAALAGATPPAGAHHDRGPGYPDWEWGTVTRSEPVIRRVRISEPHEACVERPVRERTVHHHARDPGAVLFGGLIGGVIGHQFGKGHGRDVATAAGALIGASHAAGHANPRHHVVERTVYETRCRTVHDDRWEERVEGYDVSYRWQGRTYHTWMPQDPGRRVRVRVDVVPAADHD